MHHVTFADKSLLIGDEAAHILLEYAAALASKDTADTVTLKAIGADGDDVSAVFLLNQGSPLMAESATTTVAEPDNSDAIEYMRLRMQLLLSPPNVLAEEFENSLDFDEPWEGRD
jgi:hypothetical protein